MFKKNKSIAFIDRITGQNPPNIIQSWPPLPPYIPLPVAKFQNIKEFDFSGETNHINPGKYEGLVIGIGPSGEKVIRNWFDLLEQEECGWQERLRVTTITERPLASPLLDTTHRLSFSCNVSPFALFEDENRQVRAIDDKPLRVELHTVFRRAAIFKQVSACLRNIIRDLQQGVRVIVLASLAEGEIGILGDVLQILRLIAKEAGDNIYSGLTALLTFSSPKPVLEEKEQYAALREIGRFTFSGIHWMEPPPGGSDGVIRSALLDQLYIIDESGLGSTSADSTQSSFDNGSGQALTEMLYALLQPSFHSVWESDLKTGIGMAADVRKNTHHSFTNSFGITTLEIPLKSIKDYIVERLTYAVLYGERKDHHYDGFLTKALNPSQESGEALAISWIKEGPMKHPILDWVFEDKASIATRALPEVDFHNEILFQGQIIHGIISQLNSVAPGRFSATQAALGWLAGRLHEQLSVLENVMSRKPTKTTAKDWKDLLNHWLATVEDLTDQIKKWENILFQNPTYVSQADAGLPTTPTDNLLPWETWKKDPRPTEPKSSVSFPFPNPHEDLERTLTQNIRKSEQVFINAASNSVCRSVMLANGEILSDVCTLYEDIIRPELSHFNMDDSILFQHLRERLGWWAELKPGKQPQLYMICVPVDSTGIPREVGRYTPENAIEIANLLRRNARVLVRELAPGLNNWFQRRVEHMLNFLDRARLPILEYDQDSPDFDHFTTQSYIFGPLWLNNIHSTSIFPHVAEQQIKIVTDKELTRLTALTLHFNIPLDSVSSVRKVKKEYTYQPHLHIYQQEQNATFYEQKIRKISKNWTELPPEIVMALADIKLVRLFFKALFLGLICIYIDNDSDTQVWSLKPIANKEKFDRLQLSLALGKNGLDTLIQAFNNFVLELPNNPNQQQNPQNHFYVFRRPAFVQTLEDAVENYVQQNKRKTIYKNIPKSFREKVQNQETVDALTLAFLHMLESEWDEIVWTN